MGDCSVPFQHRTLNDFRYFFAVCFLLQSPEEAAVHHECAYNVGYLHDEIIILPRKSPCAERRLQFKPVVLLYFESQPSHNH